MSGNVADPTGPFVAIAFAIYRHFPGSTEPCSGRSANQHCLSQGPAPRPAGVTQACEALQRSLAGRSDLDPARGTYLSDQLRAMQYRVLSYVCVATNGPGEMPVPLRSTLRRSRTSEQSGDRPPVR